MQLAQVTHVTTEFALRYPDEARSTPVGIVLQVPDEDALIEYAVSGGGGVLFREEDLDGEATAYAEVSEGRRFSDLPLAGRVMADT